NEGIPWRRVLGILKRHWKASAAFVVAIELCLAALVLSLDYTYETRATVEVETPTASTTTLNNQPVPQPAEQDYVGTQAAILRGDGLALGVIKELHLSDNPLFLKQSWIEKWPAKVMGLITSSRKAAQSDTERLLEIYRSRLTVDEVRNSRLIEIRY